ncbi:MAG: phage holin family protein [Chloroflexi bacterium]|nr:phage holin family protein [Chloroflexota bacterium]
MMTPPASPRRGLLGIGRALLSELQILVRQEITLAKQELIAKLMHDVKAAALILVAAPLLVLVLFLVIFFEVADLLGYVVGHFWLGLLLTWLLFTVVLGLIGFVGIRRLRSPVPELTIASLKEDLEWVRTQVRRISR